MKPGASVPVIDTARAATRWRRFELVSGEQFHGTRPVKAALRSGGGSGW
jgi:hypothetical protein